MAQSALLGAAALAGQAWNRRDDIKRGAETGVELAKIGHSAGKKLANNLFSVKGRKKTSRMLLDKIKNPVRSAKELSDFIASGKAMKVAGKTLGHVSRAITAAEQISGRDLSGTRGILSNVSNEANRYHDVLSQYNTQARDLLGV